MQYLVFSDLHGSRQGLALLREAVQREKPDCLICLGDTLHGAYDGDSHACADYLSHCAIPIFGVMGNCDSYYDESALGFALPYEQTLYFAGHRLILRHAPFYYGAAPGDIQMSGHTHIKTLSVSSGIISLNPGSIGRPRDGTFSYALLNENRIALVNAETGNVLKELAL